MASPPTRRWFQFRLRTLLIGVVLISVPCAYVSREAWIVATRKSWLAQHEQIDIAGGVLCAAHPTAYRDLPLIRRLLGDVPQDFIEVRDSADVPLAAQLFPEAEIDII